LLAAAVVAEGITMAAVAVLADLELEQRLAYQPVQLT
jgi:hypothetical protein